jgi:hypothetical protein
MPFSISGFIRPFFDYWLIELTFLLHTNLIFIQSIAIHLICSLKKLFILIARVLGHDFFGFYHVRFLCWH